MPKGSERRCAAPLFSPSAPSRSAAGAAPARASGAGERVLAGRVGASFTGVRTRAVDPAKGLVAQGSVGGKRGVCFLVVGRDAMLRASSVSAHGKVPVSLCFDMLAQVGLIRTSWVHNLCLCAPPCEVRS